MQGTGAERARGLGLTCTHEATSSINNQEREPCSLAQCHSLLQAPRMRADLVQYWVSLSELELRRVLIRYCH